MDAAGDYGDIIREFLVESYEGLDRLDRALVALETDPANAALLADIFRTIHTIKGTGGFLGFPRLEAISHVGENLLSTLRDGALALTPEITSTLLRTVDAVRALLASIEASGAEHGEDYSALIEDLRRHCEPNDPGEPGEPRESSELGELAAPALAPDAVLARTDDKPTDDRRTGDDRRQGLSDSSLRVHVGLLDKLMNLVGELVLARNQIVQFASGQSEPALLGATQRLNLVTSELQESVMKTRMQPIDNVWSKFPRLVRDLAAACGKQARLEMVGRETELDKTILEAIRDPLTHVVRNAIDHGLEPPAERLAAGKPSEGVLRLRAWHEGGHINIEMADDGGGIRVERVKARAVQRGLLTAEQAARLSEQEAVRLVFLPGFSTAERVTNVSGRGVGMDVVKTNIEKIGGTVDIDSAPGAGTTLRIKIPLTLAIIPALMIAVGDERFAIPQVNLLELVRLDGDQASASVERIGAAACYRLRGSLLPLVYLHDELGLTAPSDAAHGVASGASATTAADAVNIVVLNADGCQFGLVVGAVSDTEEIVVKPLGKQLKSVDLFAGATIMGDGRVALILDVLGIAQRAGVMSRAREAAAAAREARAATLEAASAHDALLLFRAGTRQRMAMPLAMVARLEELDTTSIEQAGGRDAVQYRGEILPLVRVARFFGEPEPDTRHASTLQIIVVHDRGARVGLVVDTILDVVSDAAGVTRVAPQPGLLGSAIIQGCVTDFLDVRALTRELDAAETPAASAA